MTTQPDTPQPNTPRPDTHPPGISRAGTSALAHRHLRIGWWSLTVFILLGATLEAMHGFKVAWYLNVGDETRRLMWRLAHAHGTFLALVHIAFALSLTMTPDRRPRLASPCLVGAGIAIPAGFLLGGWTVYGGDPGPGILLLPVGAALLIVAVVSTALAMTREDRADQNH